MTAADPVRPDDGGAPARRAVGRWAWRLFRREWRQQLLVLALIAVAVAATVLGAAVATNTPPPAAAGFGTAGHLVYLPDRSGITAVAARFGPVDAIENQPLVTGLAHGAQLRAQDPHGRYGRPMLALVSGHWPAGPAEVAMTTGLTGTLGLAVGDTWTGRRLVGVVENPQNLLDTFALVAPGQLTGPSDVTVLFDGPAAEVTAFTFPDGATAIAPDAPTGMSPAVIVLVFAVVGLVFVGLVATAGFTVLGQRRLRALGTLSAIGATGRHVRRVMVTNGALVGAVGALLGAVIGLGAWIAYAPRFSAAVNHRVAWTSLPWWLVATAVALAVATATLAAQRPARAVSRVSVVAALSGRPVTSVPARRSVRWPVAVLAAGPLMLAFSGGWGATDPLARTLTLGGLLATVIGLMLLAPVAVGLLGAMARRVPFTARLALRDLDRYRSRSGPALAASSLAVLIAVMTCLLATGRFADSVDYVGPNLPTDQLMIYAPGHGGTAGPVAAGPDQGGGPGSGPARPATAGDPSATAAAIADAVGSRDVLTLDTVAAGLARCHVEQGHSTCSSNGTLYVATPAVLARFGIDPASIGADTILLTSRPGLDGVSGLQLVDFPPPDTDPANPPDPVTVKDPRIQFSDRIPSGASDPNLLVTEKAVRDLNLRVTPAAAWLVRTARPPAAIQINTARQLAVRAGLTIETTSAAPSLDQVRDYATGAGILLALGVLAMTVGLIRAETAGDLRILAATGARRRTRRRLTAITAGALGLVAALLGTAVGYVATTAFFRDALSERMGRPPVVDLLLILVGLPVAATVGGWLFAAREPDSLARVRLE